jgi:hypothetical protein
MTSRFAGFIPAGDPIVKPIALALTAGVLADTSRPQLPTDRKA